MEEVSNDDRRREKVKKLLIGFGFFFFIVLISLAVAHDLRAALQADRDAANQQRIRDTEGTRRMLATIEEFEVACAYNIAKTGGSVEDAQEKCQIEGKDKLYVISRPY